MREILFRGRLVDNGEWVYGGVTSKNHSISGSSFIVSNIHFEGHEEEEHFECIKIHPETIGQFTGLLDKNGKKIFEGDVLNENGYLFIVIFDDVWAKFNLKHDKKTIQYPGWNRGVMMEIIGNIHDNPELIK